MGSDSTAAAHGVRHPGCRTLSALDGRRQYRVGAAPGELGSGQSAAARASAAPGCGTRAGPVSEPLSEATFGRAEAARGHCEGAGWRSTAAPIRRTLRGARPHYTLRFAASVPGTAAFR